MRPSRPKPMSPTFNFVLAALPVTRSPSFTTGGRCSAAGGLAAALGHERDRNLLLRRDRLAAEQPRGALDGDPAHIARRLGDGGLHPTRLDHLPGVVERVKADDADAVGASGGGNRFDG